MIIYWVIIYSTNYLFDQNKCFWDLWCGLFFSNFCYIAKYWNSYLSNFCSGIYVSYTLNPVCYWFSQESVKWFEFYDILIFVPDSPTSLYILQLSQSFSSFTIAPRVLQTLFNILHKKFQQKRRRKSIFCTGATNKGAPCRSFNLFHYASPKMRSIENVSH